MFILRIVSNEEYNLLKSLFVHDNKITSLLGSMLLWQYFILQEHKEIRYAAQGKIELGIVASVARRVYVD